MKTTPAIRIESHPPERRRRTETLMCGCCCCCCCCLHTVGALVATAVAPAFGKRERLPIHYYYDEEYDITVPDITRTGPSAVRVFWLLTLAFTILGVMIGFVGGGEGLIVGLVIVAMVFPAVQLLSAIIVLFWLAVSTRPDKRQQLKLTGKIVLGLVIGTVAGILTMVAIGVVLSNT